jgi:ectoine hydroxylase-related dioxygenase (phytanoyl-CoA dioxygenase family)
MSNKIYLKSYSELEILVESSEKYLSNIFNKKWKEFNYHISLFAINKYSENERARIQANDYFNKIVKEPNKISLNESKISKNQYSKAVKVLITNIFEIFEILSINIVKNIIEIKSSGGSFFILNENDNELSKFIFEKKSIRNFNNTKLAETGENIINWFETDPLKFKNLQIWLENHNNLKFASLFTLLSVMSNLQNSKYENFFDEKRKSFFEENGYLIIENFINKEFTTELRNIVNKIAKLQLNDSSAYLYGKQKKLQRIYNLIGKSDCFIDLILDNRFETLLEYFFQRDTLHQKYYLSSYQANILYPGAESQILHTDIATPEPLPPWPVRLNLNILLDGFTEKNGSTLVLPGSHKKLRKPNLNTNLNLKKLIAPAGSLVMWTGHLWHKSGENNSNSSRSALLACYASSYMREIATEENYLYVNSFHKINQMPRKLFDLIGGTHGLKSSS